MNNFHGPALKALTERIEAMAMEDYVSEKDRELLDYFASLYKNSNKGIKGRGKDRRIAVTPASVPLQQPVVQPSVEPVPPVYGPNAAHAAPFPPFAGGIPDPRAISYNQMSAGSPSASTGSYQHVKLEETHEPSFGAHDSIVYDDQGRHELAFADRLL